MKQPKNLEEFKSIPNYPDYEVSNFGSVKSLKFGRDRVMKGYVDGHGYHLVILCKDKKMHTKKVHQLVAIAFLSHTPVKGLNVDHINNCRTDNRLENLQVISHRLNNTKDRKPKSGLTGVYETPCGKYQAKILIKGRYKYLGNFNCPTLASIAYQKEIVILNIPKQ